MRGTIRRRGGRNTVTGTMVWDLDELAAARRDHGPEAVHRLLGPDATPTPATPAARGDAPQRTIAQETGAELHPWAPRLP
ncbi:hypothetical protein [Streptomyces sp. NBC_00322]|uniref:hypothetical protein n=1 Tax=Streptomyces sp. NBC_00322 TaxID=2975712 RepID=UPI003FA6B6E9